MKLYLISSALIFAASFNAAATEPTDTLSKELDEVVINAPTVIRKADKNIYGVNEPLKERSSSAMNLINNLQIPGLNVNEVMEKITSSLGTVQIRVNGREIDADKLKTINKANIQRIEWIDNPGLRYGTNVGAVLNIILKNPTTGGSLSFNTMESLTLFFNNSNAHLTLNNGASQWQIGCGGNFRGMLEMYREYNDRYKLPDGKILERTQTPTGGYYDQYLAWPYISYNFLKPDTTNFYIGVSLTDIWKEEFRFDGILDNTLSRTDESIRLTEISDVPKHISPSVELYFEQKFKHNQTLILNASMSYTENMNGHYYAECNNETKPIVEIDNNFHNYSYAYHAQANYIKEWEKGGQISTGICYNGNRNKSIYLDYGNQKIRQNIDETILFGEYTKTFKKVTLQAGVGAIWSKSVLKGEDGASRFNISPRISLNYRASDKSRWTLIYRNSVISPGTSQLSPITQDIDGIQIQRGNPDLKSYVRHQSSLRYSYSNNSNFNLTSYINYAHISNPIFEYYTWQGDYILRTFSNRGTYNSLSCNISATYSPLPDWLSLSAEIYYNYTHNKGNGFRHTLNSWGQSFSMQLYHWNWMLDFSLDNPAETLYGEELNRGERFNTLFLSYKWKNWNFGAGLFIAFGKYSQSTKIISDLVNQSTVIRTKLQRMPMLRISYNVNWGHQKQNARRKISGKADSDGGVKAASR